MRGPQIRRVSRDSVLFIAGLAGIAFETVVDHADRPTLIILFGGMVGLPAFLGLDASRQASPPEQEPGP